MLQVLSSKGYEDTEHNYGDCIILTENGTAIIYDCGSEEHAKRAIKILDDNRIEQAIVVLSHNDDDHFKGIPYLIEEGRVKALFTILLLKYKEELLEKINDDRRTKESIGRAIMEMYDNIATLSRKVALLDVYEDADKMPNCMKFIGPNFEYMLDAVSKGLDGRQGNTIDKETITNAASVQLELVFERKRVLLTGDCTPAAIPDSVELNKYDYIQLPHHGKYIHAETIFERVGNNNQMVYLVSDNTGNSNGGSDKLIQKSAGHRVKNTKKQGDIQINPMETSIKAPGYIRPLYTGGSLGI